MMQHAASTQVYLREWWQAILNTPQIFSRIAFRRRTLEEELQEALLRGSLRKAFGAFDLLCLGLGVVIGTGWAQLTGTAAQQYAGPAIIVSYLVSGLAALTSGICYAELASEFPVSGGAFSYALVTFGELPAFCALAGLVLEYGLGMAAVARGFSDYLAMLLNQDPETPPFEFNIAGTNHSFDIIAAVIILVMSILLSLGVRESTYFISGVTVVKLGLLLFVSIASFTQGSLPNMIPFTNTIRDVDGIFMGASVVFFAFTGFDAIGNAAEEAANVAHLPWAIVGTIGTATVFYFLLALGLALMVCPNIACPAMFFLPSAGTQECKAYSPVPCPTQPCTCPAPDFAPPPPPLSATPADCYLAVTFASAFLANGMKWMQYVVSLAALSGVVTALTVGLFSLSRIVMAASRDWLLPPFLARISPRTQTPLIAQMVFGVIIAVLAMFVEVDSASALVSFGTLVTLWIVCNAQVYRRYFPEVQMRFTRYGTVETAPKVELGSRVPGRHLALRTRKYLVWLHLALINGISIATAIWYSQTEHVGTPDYTPSATPLDDACNSAATNIHHNTYALFFILAWFLATLSFQLCCPMEYEPVNWHIPSWLMPWLPALAIGLTIFSVGALPKADYWKIGFYFAVLVLIYVLFSLPMSYLRHSRVDSSTSEELKVVELAYQNGHWRTTRLAPFVAPNTAGLANGNASPKLDVPKVNSGSVRAGGRSSNPSGSGKPSSNGSRHGSGPVQQLVTQQQQRQRPSLPSPQEDGDEL